MELFQGIDSGSMYPAFFYKQQIQELKEEIESQKRRIERGEIPYEQVWKAKSELNKLEVRLSKIKDTKPKLSVGEKERLKKVFKVLSEEISIAMPTYTEVMKGTVHAHEEARRMKQPCVPINQAENEIAEMAKLCDVKIDRKKISRDGASKLWKITAAILGEAEYPNVEVLRRADKTDKVLVA